LRARADPKLALEIVPMVASREPGVDHDPFLYAPMSILASSTETRDAARYQNGWTFPGRAGR
jgi:hypothetical protein